MRAPCDICGKTFNRAETGRPRMYCSDRCKEKAKRNRRREEDRTAVARLSELRVSEYDGPAACHVCGQAAATVGSPVPLICGGCAVKGRDAA